MLCGGVEACHRYGVCTVGCVECDSCAQHSEQLSATATLNCSLC